MFDLHGCPTACGGIKCRGRRLNTGTDTKFINNTAGQILSEFTLNGYRLGDYVYLNGVLLAKLRYVLNPACADTGGPPPTGPETGGPGGDGGLCDSILVAYYYHTDHLGTPWYMTSSNKSIVWRGEYFPFGELYSETVSQPNLHRFPGQYKDQNTLYYNWHRYYDPKIGRYLQADPIGLAGLDINLYSYVENDPIDFIDPYALWRFSLSFYYGWGGTISFGSDVENGFFSIEPGYGIGAGISYDPISGRPTQLEVDQEVDNASTFGLYGTVGGGLRGLILDAELSYTLYGGVGITETDEGIKGCYNKNENSILLTDRSSSISFAEEAAYLKIKPEIQGWGFKLLANGGVKFGYTFRK